MNENPRLAVVIPSYNHAHYIRRALDSCLNQTRPPDRIVVIDDGSKDDSLVVLRGYSNRGVEVTAQENAGAHTTINRAIALAATDCDLISILNSDDHYEPARFEKCLAFLAANPECSVVCTGLNIIDDKDKALDPDQARAKWFRAIWSIGDTPDPDLCEWMGRANFPATTSNVIARADYLLANPFRAYRFNHDYFFLAKAAMEGRLGLIREPLVNYRVHATNTITTRPAPLIREMLRMHLDLYAELGPCLASEPALRANFSRYMRAANDSVSSFHAGLFQMLLAQIVSGESPATLGRGIDALDEDALDELQVFPNRALVNHHSGDGPLGADSALADRYEKARAERGVLKENAVALRDLARLRQQLLASKWAALGRALGLAKNLDTDAGKSPQEKLAALREKTEASRWLGFGRKFGFWN
jgi:glycosyltransferase involved in cell wall biosynthesis